MSRWNCLLPDLDALCVTGLTWWGLSSERSWVCLTGLSVFQSYHSVVYRHKLPMADILCFAIYLTEMENLRQEITLAKGIYVCLHLRKLAWTLYNPGHHKYCDTLIDMTLQISRIQHFPAEGWDFFDFYVYDHRQTSVGTKLRVGRY